MKLRNKLLVALAPAATIATVLPLTLTSCSKETDITIDDFYKTMELENVGTKTYDTSKYTIIMEIADKYKFDKAEMSTHTIGFEVKNLKTNSKVEGTPTLLWSGSWVYESTTGKCKTYHPKFTVTECTLDTGAEITFDLVAQFGTIDASSVFTGISQKVNLNGFKLTY